MSFHYESDTDVPGESAGPYKPTQEEIDRYYYGFARDFKLVARTSTHPWVRPMYDRAPWEPHNVQLKKRYVPISDAKIIANWTDRVSDEIVEALKPCEWTYFFPIGIQLRLGDIPGDFNGLCGVSKVLLVAVEPNKLQWEKGLSIAQKCLRILRDAGISGLEVEICESTFRPHAASTGLEAKIKQVDLNLHKQLWPMLSGLGYPVTSLENHGPEGSVGLHIQLGGHESPIYAFTCRHVVNGNRRSQDAYRVTGDEKHLFVQGSDSTVSKCVKMLESLQARLDGSIQRYKDRKKRWEEWYQYDEAFAHKQRTHEKEERLIKHEEFTTHIEKILGSLESIKEESKRIIGHLAFHSKMEISSRQAGYLKEWALIELDTSKFPAGKPDNKIYVDDKPDLSLSTDGSGLTHLKVCEAREPPPNITVFKRGMKTGLTCGIVNGIKALIRWPFGDFEFLARELVIVADTDHRNFSDVGDSGSCVFADPDEAIGVVVASTSDSPSTWLQLGESMEVKPGTHVTFATPIQWVLDDIEHYTGLKPRLCG